MQLFATALLGMFAVFPCYAQTVINLNANNSAPPMRLGGERAQTISVNLQFTTPVPALPSTADTTKTMASASQSLYDIVNRQCEVLTAALGGACRLVQLNIGGNLNTRVNNGVPTVSANANATFEIEAKAPTASPAPQ